MSNMRAKFRVADVQSFGDSERVTFTAVSKSTAYPQDGSDEDNSFARFTPQADLVMTIQNPDLLGKFKIGQRYYADFSPAGSDTQQGSVPNAVVDENNTDANRYESGDLPVGAGDNGSNVADVRVNDGPKGTL